MTPFKRGDMVKVLENSCGFPAFAARVKVVIPERRAAVVAYSANGFDSEEIPFQFLKLVCRVSNSVYN